MSSCKLNEPQKVILVLYSGTILSFLRDKCVETLPLPPQMGFKKTFTDFHKETDGKC